MSLSSYREMCDAGIFSSEESSLQYLIDKQILPDRRRCTICSGWMTLTECSRTKYKDGCAWHCCNKWVSVRVGSILHQRRIPYRQFIDLLAEFSRGSTASTAALHTGLSKSTVESIYTEIQERIAEEVQTLPKLGGPGKEVQIDEAKFGKRKYNRGRIVPGSWVLGGVESDTDKCFLALCPNNRRSEATLLPIIQQYVSPGTTIITDMWKGYYNLGNHG